MRDFSQHFPWKCSPQMAAQIRSVSGRAVLVNTWFRRVVTVTVSRPFHRPGADTPRRSPAADGPGCAYRYRSVYYLRRRLSAVTELFRDGAWTTVPERKQGRLTAHWSTSALKVCSRRTRDGAFMFGPGAPWGLDLPWTSPECATLRHVRCHCHCANVCNIVLCMSGIKDFVYQRAEGELINRIFNATSA